MAGKRIDSNQNEIVGHLERFGIQVIRLSDVGRDRPDLIVCENEIWVFIEVKRPNGKISRGQVRWHATARGWSGIATDREEALNLARYPNAFALNRTEKRRLREWLDNHDDKQLSIDLFRLIVKGRVNP